MNRSQLMPFGTEKLELSPTIFESMINNMGSRLRKMNLKLEFFSEENKANFIKALNRLEQQGEEAQFQSSEEEGEKEEKKPAPSVVPSVSLGQESLVIDEPFEVSILLRERFMDQLMDIGQRLNVKFMVIPNKVKIIGRSIDKVGDAQDQYREIKNNLCLENIEKYGKQVHQSRYYKQLLLNEKVQIMQILRKYYVWFEKHKTDPTDVLKEVFQTTYHRNYPLILSNPQSQHIREPLDVGKAQVVHGTINFIKCQERFTDKLITSVRAQLFQRFISQNLNDLQERQGRQVQLSEDRKLLLLHMDAAEQEIMIKKHIDEAFQPFTYIFFILPTAEQTSTFAKALSQCSNMTGFKRQKSSPRIGFVWAVQQNYICVSYLKNKQPLEGNELSNHGLAKLMDILPEQSLNFKLGMKAELDQPEEEQWSSKFIFEKIGYHQMTIIGPKSQIRNRYQQLARLLLVNQLDFEYLTRNRNRSVIANDTTVDAVIDISHKIEESSMVYSKVEDKSISKQNMGSVIDSTVVLPKDIVASTNFKFQGYNFNIFQKAGLKKSEMVDNLVKVEVFKIQFAFTEGEKLLAQETGGKYKFYRLKVPSAHQKKLQTELQMLQEKNGECRAYERWVTVYVGAPAENLLINDKINVGKVSKGSGVKDGYLVLTNLAFLYAEGGNQLASHQYEPICYIRKLT